MTNHDAIPRQQHLKSMIRGLYDFFMEKREPELTTEVLPMVDILHEGETSEEKKMRYAGYAAAFEDFEKMLQMLVGTWKREVGDHARGFRKLEEGKATEEDRRALQQVERMFSDDAS